MEDNTGTEIIHCTTESEDLEFQCIDVNEILVGNYVECDAPPKLNQGKNRGRHRQCIGLFGNLGEQFETDLLKEVFNRPCLYDYTLPIQERHEDLVKENWLELLEVLKPRYGQLNMEQCIRIWRNCRDQYVRYKLQKTREKNGEIVKKTNSEPPNMELLKQLDIVSEKRRQNLEIYQSKVRKKVSGTENSYVSYSSKFPSSVPTSILSVGFRKIAPKSLSNIDQISSISSPVPADVLAPETSTTSYSTEEHISNIETSVSSSFPKGFIKITPKELLVSSISSGITESVNHFEPISTAQPRTESAPQQEIPKKTSAKSAFSCVVESFIDNLPVQKKYDAQSFLLRAMQQYLEENNLFDIL